jgi:small subunit ribosomal protein S17
MENKNKNKKTEVGTQGIVGAETSSSQRVGTRGRTFQGKIIKKFPKRVVIEFERSVFVRKYERYAKSKTKIHARVPPELEDKVKIGDLIKVRECRPLSKIIHFLVIEKVKDAEEVKKPETKDKGTKEDKK